MREKCGRFPCVRQLPMRRRAGGQSKMRELPQNAGDLATLHQETFKVCILLALTLVKSSNCVEENVSNEFVTASFHYTTASTNSLYFYRSNYVFLLFGSICWQSIWFPSAMDCDVVQPRIFPRWFQVKYLTKSFLQKEQHLVNKHRPETVLVRLL